MSIQKVNIETIWSTASWRLDVETWKMANGRLMEKGTVRHPGSIVLIPVRETANGPEIIMIQQYRHTLDQVILELPAGTMEWEEEAEQCAQRELREETGFRAAHLVNLGQCWPAPGVSDELMTFFLAKTLIPDPLPMDDDEQIEVAPTLLPDLLSMCRMGKILDGKSIVGLMKAEIYLQG